MLIDEEVYLDYEAQDFFEHHGIKGQKWGIRNKIKKYRSRTPKPGSFRALPKPTQHKVIAGVVGGTAVIGGGAIAAAILRNKGHLKFLDYKRAKNVQDAIKAGQGVVRSSNYSKPYPEALKILKTTSKPGVPDIETMRKRLHDASYVWKL